MQSGLELVNCFSLIKKNYGHLEKFEYKDLSVNFNSYTAKINGEEIDVNAKELEVLKLTDRFLYSNFSKCP